MSSHTELQTVSICSSTTSDSRLVQMRESFLVLLPWHHYNKLFSSGRYSEMIGSVLRSRNAGGVSKNRQSSFIHGCHEWVVSLYQEFILRPENTCLDHLPQAWVLSVHEDSSLSWPRIRLRGLSQPTTTHTCLLCTTRWARPAGVYSGIEGWCTWVWVMEEVLPHGK